MDKNKVNDFLKEYEKLCLKYELTIRIDRFYDVIDVSEHFNKLDVGYENLDFKKALRIEIEKLKIK